ncbi:precorrin-2 dehydrogenase/sirohydrochlorin ferrochelatase family protein [Senegalia massiliensis]|uniref:precorrin-2 dehydrogenase/sirohydrochlorin ferrochelatase family protein n=1 Tax=Senegalia massiliensis TaxID=1720316 RepID=UPI001F5E4A05|nr:bifunctional precorrin-2 dehydrogenase/sirohydrochlorin ferrochelatase [Senegalia massiliensis]
MSYKEETSFYPVMLNLKDKNIVIIGAGKVALRKAKKLMEYGGKLSIISPKIESEFYNYKNKINIIKDKYNKKYILNSSIVIAATDDKKLNRKISIDCKDENILCNNITGKNSDFIVPSTFKRGDLTISVSTNGKSPSLSKSIIFELEKKYDEKYIEFLKLLGDIRKIVLEKCNDEKRKKEILNEIINLSLDDLKGRKKLYENKSRL